MSVPDIGEWWPWLHEVVRETLVNGIWSPLSPFQLEQIADAGGPAVGDDDWLKIAHGERYLPGDAVRWIIAQPDFSSMLRPPQPDPRAAYFRGTWPNRRRG